MASRRGINRFSEASAGTDGHLRRMLPGRAMVEALQVAPLDKVCDMVASAHLSEDDGAFIMRRVAGILAAVKKAGAKVTDGLVEAAAGIAAPLATEIRRTLRRWPTGSSAGGMGAHALGVIALGQ
jgi:hypothetical protein